MTSDSAWPIDFEQLRAPTRTAAKRIRRQRRHLDAEGAAAILQTELDRAGVAMPREQVESIARWLHHGFLWPLRHPLRARSEGVFWKRHPAWVLDPWDVPRAIHDEANREAWRLAGQGIGPLAEGLEPAECKHVGEHEYACVAQVKTGRGHPQYLIEMTLTEHSGQVRVDSSTIHPA